MTSTSSSVIILVATFTADSALDSLSSMTSSTGYFFPPTARPPAAFMSSSHIWAANLRPLAHLGDVSGERGVDADLDRLLCLNLSGREERQTPRKDTNTDEQPCSHRSFLLFCIRDLPLIPEPINSPFDVYPRARKKTRGTLIPTPLPMEDFSPSTGQDSR